MKRSPLFAKAFISAAFAFLALVPSCRKPANPLLGDWYLFKAQFGKAVPLDFPPERQQRISFLETSFSAENDPEKYEYTYARKGNELRLITIVRGQEIAETITLIDGETLKMSHAFPDGASETTYWMTRKAPPANKEIAQAAISAGAAAAALSSFISAFPEITMPALEIDDESPFDSPQEGRRDESLDMATVTRILGWEAPAPRWDPNMLEIDGPPNYTWERGFYALGRAERPGFRVLVLFYWEAAQDRYSASPSAAFEYRLYTIRPDGAPIDQLTLLSQVLPDGDPKSSLRYGGRAGLRDDLSLSVEKGYLRDGSDEGSGSGISRYRIAEDGRILKADDEGPEEGSAEFPQG